MEKTARHVIKGNDVKLEGQVRLDVGQGDPSLANEKNATSSLAQVRIVENHPEFAVLEVACGCGAKTHIKCEYSDAQHTEQGSDQKIN